jgi:hypothetical protein
MMLFGPSQPVNVTRAGPRAGPDPRQRASPSGLPWLMRYRAVSDLPERNWCFEHSLASANAREFAPFCAPVRRLFFCHQCPTTASVARANQRSSCFNCSKVTAQKNFWPLRAGWPRGFSNPLAKRIDMSFTEKPSSQAACSIVSRAGLLANARNSTIVIFMPFPCASGLDPPRSDTEASRCTYTSY